MKRPIKQQTLKETLERVAAANAPLDATARLDAIEATGRAVNGADVASIETAAGSVPREFAYTAMELARMLNVDRSTVNVWKRIPGFPKKTLLHGREKWNVAEVRDFMRSHDLNRRAEPVEDETKALMREFVRAKITAQDIKNETARGELLPKNIEAAALAAGVVNAKNEVLRIPQMAIELVGLNAPDMEKKLRGWIVGALKSLYVGPTPEVRAQINRYAAEIFERIEADQKKPTEEKVETK